MAGVGEAQMALLQSMPSASYAAAKAGIEVLTWYIAGKVGPHNIRVNCVRPGRIAIPRMAMGDGAWRWDAYFDSLQMLKGIGRPEDVANTALFLASDEARFITAETINVDGGAAGKV